MNFAIVVSRYNQNITRGLLAGALSAFRKRGISLKSIEVVWVPGAFEIPIAAKKLAKRGKFGAVIALGCVMKGETSHNRHISEAVSHGLMSVALETGIPVTFGVLTPDKKIQAQARSRPNSANKGMEAAVAAIEMVEILQSIKR